MVFLFSFRAKLMGMKKTVLIFGVSSFVGSNLAEFLSDEYRVIGTYHRTPVSIPGVICLPCDILNKEYITNLIAIFKPNFTIYAVGLSSIAQAQDNPKKADALNSSGASFVTAASERYGARFIYISSSYVLAGDDMLYKESDTPFPNTAYGSSMSSTEFFIQRSSLNYLILRSCPLYGRSYNPNRPNWFEGLQTALAKSQGMPTDDMVKTGFLDIFLLVRVIKSLMEMNVSNRLLHVSTTDIMTRFEFGKLYAKLFRKDENLVQPGSGSFPADMSSRKTKSNKFFYRMDTANLESLLGLSMPSIEDSLLLTQQRLSTGIFDKLS
jgi:dTDP-4-dehydrorhamnose reductase